MLRKSVYVIAVLWAALLVWNGTAQAQKAEVLWLGQAATRITTTTGKVIVIDPFLQKNPKTPAQYKDLKALGKVDVILVSHGHFDHSADVGELAKLTGAKVVGNAELVRQLIAFGVIDKGQGIAMNKGGTVTPMGPDVRITMVPADHSSGLSLPNPKTQENELVYAGAPVGYVVRLENGFTIYHTGDTNVFGDMALVHTLYAPDLVLACIGGHFTMDPAGAAYAMRELVKPKQVIPIHYATFPPLKGTPAELKAALAGSGIEVLDVEPGQAKAF